MSNPSKIKGTRAESDLVRWARVNGFPHAERLALAGAVDGGDVRLVPLGWTAGMIVIEVKAHATAGRGIPPDAQLADWMREAERERVAARAVHCPLVLRRAGPGSGDPGRWWSWIPLWSIAALVGGYEDSRSNPVCLDLASLAVLLRTAGYGAPPEPTLGAPQKAGPSPQCPPRAERPAESTPPTGKGHLMPDTCNLKRHSEGRFCCAGCHRAFSSMEVFDWHRRGGVCRDPAGEPERFRVRSQAGVVGDVAVWGTAATFPAELRGQR